jgi:GxxExxY protein
MENDIEAIAADIVDAAIHVHRPPGPGLLESAYQTCLAFELRKRQRKTRTEVLLPILYEGQKIDAGYRIDMLIDDLVMVENKVVDSILPIHEAQLLTYMKLKEVHIGFLLNWNVRLMKNGIRRLVHNLPEPGRYPQRTEKSLCVLPFFAVRGRMSTIHRQQFTQLPTPAKA